jgi:hypothetical protein
MLLILPCWPHNLQQPLYTKCTPKQPTNKFGLNPLFPTLTHHTSYSPPLDLIPLVLLATCMIISHHLPNLLGLTMPYLSPTKQTSIHSCLYLLSTPHLLLPLLFSHIDAAWNKSYSNDPLWNILSYMPSLLTMGHPKNALLQPLHLHCTTSLPLSVLYYFPVCLILFSSSFLSIMTTLKHPSSRAQHCGNI